MKKVIGVLVLSMVLSIVLGAGFSLAEDAPLPANDKCTGVLFLYGFVPKVADRAIAVNIQLASEQQNVDNWSIGTSIRAFDESQKGWVEVPSFYLPAKKSNIGLQINFEVPGPYRFFRFRQWGESPNAKDKWLWILNTQYTRNDMNGKPGYEWMLDAVKQKIAQVPANYGPWAW